MLHSILPPSSAAQWGKCGGWVELQKFAPPEEETEESRVGTAVHELCALMVTGGWIGEAAENGIAWDAEAYECAEIFKSVVAIGAEVEKKLPIRTIHPECFGTPDAMHYDPIAKRLYIWDYKHGYGIVEPFENFQLISYAAGALDYYGVHDFDITVELVVVQPRAPHPLGPVRSWKVRGEELRPYINRLANAANENLNGGGKCRTGEHCYNCPARTVCHTAVSNGLALFQIAQRPTPVQLDDEALSQLLALSQYAKKLFSKLEDLYAEQLKNRIMSGAVVQGWTVEQKLSNLKWTKSTDEVIALGELVGVDLRKATEVITPTQARKAGVPEELLRAYSAKESAGVSLTRAENSQIQLIFKGVKNGTN